MPMYNAQEYIIDSVDSILNQTYQNWRLIIVNDGSTDDSLSILQSECQSSKINVISLSSNQGIVSALNEGIEFIHKFHPKTQFIARMDADDIALPNRIQLQINFMMNHPETHVLGTAVDVLDDITNSTLKTISYQCLSPLSIRWSVLFFCPLHHPTVMIRNVDFEHIRYHNVFPHCEDYHLWIRLMFEERWNFANLKESTLKLRRNQTGNSIGNSAGNQSKNSSENPVQIASELKTVNVSRKYRDQQRSGSIALVHQYVAQRLLKDDTITMEHIRLIRSPDEIVNVRMYVECYRLLEQWEQFILRDVVNGKFVDAEWVKDDCDRRMAELISLCMQKHMMQAIQMMQRWKRREPNKDLLQNIL